MADQNYEAFGLAAMLPGMVHAVELMQAQIDAMKSRLAGLQNTEAPPRKQGGRRRGRKGDGTAAYWAAMTPEERSKEMKRRVKKRAANKAMHPHDPRHPDHEAWRKKASAAAKKRWKNMSFKDRKERLAKMLAGRVNGAAEAIQ